MFAYNHYGILGNYYFTMNDQDLKRCWRCDTTKPISEYCRSGKDSVCSICRYALNSEWAKDNREKLRPKRAKYMREYRARKADQMKVLQDIANNRQNPPKPEE